ncbi:MAG: porin family protein [Candidatus Delongbacteria bacterium]
MKVCALSVILLCLTVYAQSDVSDAQIPAKLNWGIKGGVNFAKFSGDHFDESETDFNHGLVVGLFSERSVNDAFSVQWELLYTMKGVSQNYSESYSDAVSEYEYSSEADLNFDYIEVPVSFRFKFPTGSGFTPSFYAGGTAAVNVKAEADFEMSYYEYYDDGITFNEYTQNDSGTEDLNDVNPLELGLIFGIGINFPLQNGTLLLDARYNYGLTSLVEDDGSNVYNRVWSISLGYGL